eukprot:COSAG01_NODE_1769_length_9272_cov_34.805298_5_plen_348_part_00
MFANDTSGICNNDPIINWTDEEVQRWGLRLQLKDGCSPPPPEARRIGHALLPMEQPVEPRTIYAMDFITDLCDCGPSCTPYNMVLVLVDSFSDRVFAWPARKTDTSLDISNLILRKLIHEAGRGYPLDIRCDNDSRFARAVMENLLASRGTNLCRTCPNHSLANGKVERVNQALEILIRGVALTPRYWLSRLQYAVYMLNCRRRRRLGGLSPYEVENGATPIGPLDMAGPLQHREVPVDLASMAKVMDQHKTVPRGGGMADLLRSAKSPILPNHRPSEEQLASLSPDRLLPALCVHTAAGGSEGGSLLSGVAVVAPGAHSRARGPEHTPSCFSRWPRRPCSLRRLPT